MSKISKSEAPRSRRAPRVTRELGRALRMDRNLGSLGNVRAWKRSETHELRAPAGAHPHMELAWIRSGHLGYRVGKRTEIAAPGSIVLVPKEHEHQNTFFGSLEGGALSVPDWLAEDAALALFGTSKASIEDMVIVPGAGKLGTIGDAILEELRTDAAGSTSIAESLAEAMIVAATRAALGSRETKEPSGGPVDERIRRASDKMRECLADPISIDALAKEANMSRFHFSRLFRSQLGKAPYAYLLELRLERARRLLVQKNHSVTSAALDAGFSDLGRFATMFRRRYGTSPSVFRRAAIGESEST